MSPGTTLVSNQTSSKTLVEAIEAAHQNLAGHVINTPTIRLPWLDGPGREVWAKLECQQHTGSFKYRNAFNALRDNPYQYVITGSAGNHALATAAAGKRLGKKVQVIAPETASELKVNRLVIDANVTLLGRDLFEASEAAIGRAHDSPRGPEKGVYYLSPYADFAGAAGAGTMMVEVTEDVGSFDKVIVPLGGGGLAAAIGAWCSVRSPDTEVICTHPAVFGRQFIPGMPFSEQLRRRTPATYSDGLAVQLTETTPFAEILDTTIKSVIQVDESLTASSIACILRLQSLLVEGAAATTVAALMDSTGETDNFQGRVLLLLTGGNVSSDVVAKALVAHVADPRMRQKLGLRHIINAVERHGSIEINHTVTGQAMIPRNHPPSYHIWQSLLASLMESLNGLETQMQVKLELSDHICLQIDPWVIKMFNDLRKRLVQLIDELQEVLKEQESVKLPLWTVEERYRVLLQMQSCIAMLCERASAAYDQSKRDWFFDISSQNTTAVNYDRYGVGKLRAMEIRLVNALGLGQESIELLLTSSGMAAFTTIQLYLLQQLNINDNILLPPYIYFEAMEQLQGLKHINLLYSPTFDAEDIVHEAEKTNAHVVFIDPVANIVGLPTTNIRHFAKIVCSCPGWADRIVVIDGTMVSGGMTIYDWFKGPHAPTVLYYESASKYLQLGLDLQMAGVVVYPSRLDECMRTIRRNAGTVLYSRGATLMPPVDYRLYQTRTSLLSDNAEKIHEHLQTGLRSVAEACFPNVWREFGWRHGGALITICLLGDGMNNKEGLEACIELILRAAEARDTPLTKGVSFGFSTSRISAASSMARDSEPFLRIAVGIDMEDISGLTDAVLTGVQEYVRLFS